MDSKKTFCGATTHTRSAPPPKVFLFLICFLFLNYGVIFASSTVKYDLEDFVNKFPYIPESTKTTMLNTSNWQNVERWNEQYDYIYIWAYFGTSSLTWDTGTANSYIGFGFTNSSELEMIVPSGQYRHTVTLEKVQLFNGNGTARNNTTTMDFNSSYGFFLYSEPNLQGTFNSYDLRNDRWIGIKGNQGMNYTYNRSGFPFDMTTVNYLQGYEPIPEKPWFEFAAEKIGTTTLENEDGNINVYYPTSFRGWANSYTSGKEIGFLYVPKGNTDYNTTFSYLTKSNLNMTQSWEYINNSIFKEEETNIYTKYSINLENYLITTPYFYNIKIDNKTNEEDINIKFVIINQSTTGGTIVDNSGDIISGDATKDETTIGDIQNTITEPYNPNNNILNNMTSGDILGNMGYSPTNDPNNDLWDTIINGLKETLTGSGEQTFSFKLRKTEHTISSEDIYIPDGVIKIFISLFVNFWLLMQMFQFIKRTIDQINEGSMKVMDTVDADCYFF